MALHPLLSLSLGVGSPEEEGKTAGATCVTHQIHQTSRTLRHGVHFAPSCESCEALQVLRVQLIPSKNRAASWRTCLAHSAQALPFLVAGEPEILHVERSIAKVRRSTSLRLLALIKGYWRLAS